MAGWVTRTGHRVQIREDPDTHRYTWRILSIDGRTVLLASGVDYSDYKGASKMGKFYYGKMLKLLLERDPEKQRKQITNWRGPDLPKEWQDRPENVL